MKRILRKALQPSVSQIRAIKDYHSKSFNSACNICWKASKELTSKEVHQTSNRQDAHIQSCHQLALLRRLFGLHQARVVLVVRIVLLDVPFLETVAALFVTHRRRQSEDISPRSCRYLSRQRDEQQMGNCNAKVAEGRAGPEVTWASSPPSCRVLQFSDCKVHMTWGRL